MPIDNVIWHARVGIFNSFAYIVLSPAGTCHSAISHILISHFNDFHCFFILGQIAHCFMLTVLMILISPLLLLLVSASVNVSPLFCSNHFIKSFEDFVFSFSYAKIFCKITIMFLFRLFLLPFYNLPLFTNYLSRFSQTLTYILLYYLYVDYINETILLSCGDIENNPGPTKSNLSFCHWNVNGIAAHDFVKVSLIEAFITTNDYDIMCLSETFLDSQTNIDDNRLDINGYNLLRADHPSGTKRGGVCMYYKDFIPVSKRDDLCCMNECLVTEILLGTEKCFITCLYRSPSQNNDEFENFCTDFNLLLTSINNENPSCSVVLGDFNAKCSKWWPGNKENLEGREIYSLTSTAGYSQLINQPTHTINTSSSCIDLIFCSNTKIITESGVEKSLFDKCHHNLIFGKMNFKIPLPPPYKREIWDYGKANVDGINRSIKDFNWRHAFQDLPVDDKVRVLTNTLSNIFHNFIPNKIIKCNSRKPPWMTYEITSALKERSKLTKAYYRSGQSEQTHNALTKKSKECTEMIIKEKSEYIRRMSQKLNDTLAAPKTYWTILNRFLHNKKIPLIPPLLVNGEVVSDFSTKAELFNEYFASQCTPLNNSSMLPPFSYKTVKRINSIRINEKDISSIIRSLNPNKAHGWDNISIRMIQLCDKSLAVPLKLIFESAISEGTFPKAWKKGNIVPVHKKESKNLIKNYRPISLLPIFGKIFERIIYNSLFFYFYSNKLFTKSQSGFLPGDSCVSQLLSIIHEIQTAFDCNPTLDVRGVFLDISKAFDKVWYEGLLFKLKSYGVENHLYNLLEDYLKDRQQRVVLNGKCSSWKNVLSGVPQGSVLGPLLFLIYINDLPEGIHSICKIFADDTSLFSKVYDKNKSQNELNLDLQKISQWAFQWKMQFNPDQNKQANEVIFTRKFNITEHPPIKFNNNKVSKCASQKHLGLTLDSNLNFNEHIEEKINKCNKIIGLIKRLSVTLPRKALLTIYKSFVRPHLDYADILYDHPFNECFKSKIEKVQYSASLAITGAIRGTSRERLYQELGLEPLYDRRWYRKLLFFYKIINGLSPDYLQTYLKRPTDRAYCTRATNKNNFDTFNTRTEYFKNSFFPYCVNEWNKLNQEIKNAESIFKFKHFNNIEFHKGKSKLPFLNT